MRVPALIAAALISLLPLGAAARAQTAPPPATTASDLVARHYGISGQVSQVESNPTVGTTSTLLVKLAPSRYDLLIVDMSTSNCEVTPSNTVSSTKGIILAAGGGSVDVNFLQDLTLPTAEWWAVCGAASSQLYVKESFLQ